MAGRGRGTIFQKIASKRAETQEENEPSTSGRSVAEHREQAAAPRANPFLERSTSRPNPFLGRITPGHEEQASAPRPNPFSGRSTPDYRGDAASSDHGKTESILSRSASQTGRDYPEERYGNQVSGPVVSKGSGRGLMLANIRKHIDNKIDKGEGRPIGRGRGALLERLNAFRVSRNPSETTPSDSASAGASAVSVAQASSSGLGPAGVNVQVRDKTKMYCEMTLEEKLQVGVRLDDNNPPTVRRGIAATPIDACVNYVHVTVTKEKELCEYDVRFSPEIDHKGFRFELLKRIPAINTSGCRTFDGGNKLFLPMQLSGDVITEELTHPGDPAAKVIVKITFIRKASMRDCTYFYNILFNNIQQELGLTKDQRKGRFYDQRAAQTIDRYRLECWPGYVSVINEYEGGLMLCCDTTSRVLRNETAYEIIKEARRDINSFQDTCRKELIGEIVITRYNDKTYKIDDIDFKLKPSSTFPLKNGESISFAQYFKVHHKLEIRDLNQPMLVSRMKERKRLKVKGVQEEDTLVCLVPEFCNMTGLTEKQRSDFTVMKEVNAVTKLQPTEKHGLFRKFLHRVNDNPKVTALLNQWGLKIGEEPIQLKANLLEDETMYFGGNRKFKSFNGSWMKGCSSLPVFRSVEMKYWVMVFTRRNDHLARIFIDMMIQLASTIGMFVASPQIKVIDDDKTTTYISAITNGITRDTQIVVCMFPAAREDRYNAVKRLCYGERGIHSQVVNYKTLNNEKRRRAIIQNILLQMNVKLGGASWAVDIPIHKTMLCGIDAYHETNKNSVGAFVASLDEDYTQWYSLCAVHKNSSEFISVLKSMVSKCLVHRLATQRNLPEKIILFRDGIGDGQLKTGAQHEIDQIMEAVRSVAVMYNPTLTYIVVSKRINTRIFINRNNRIENAPPGTVLDHTVTRRNFYDFFIVPQHVREGIACPTHCIVLRNDNDLDTSQIQRLTYKLTHMYYNWPGTVRVPAPCQYAHKLAYMVGKAMKTPHQDCLNETLFYL